MPQASSAHWPPQIIVEAFNETFAMVDFLRDNVYPEHLDVPTVDQDALFERIVEAVRNPQEAPVELQQLGPNFLKDNLLGQVLARNALGEEEIEGTDLFIPELITSCASKLGYRLLDEFKQLRLYDEHGELRYSYKGMTDDQSIVLWKRGRHG